MIPTPARARLFAILAASVSFMFSTAFAQDSASREELDDLVDQVEELYEETQRVDENGMPVTSDRVFEGSKTATGSMKVASDLLARVSNRAVQMQNDYITNLQRAGWFVILDGNRLSADSDFSESRRIIASARDLVDAQDQLSLDMIAEFDAEIETLPFESEEFRRGFIEGFRRSQRTGHHDRNRLFALERKSVDEVEMMINLLERRRDYWYFENGQVMFEEDRDVNAFNQHLTNINNYVAEQENIRREIVERNRRKIDERF